MLVSLGEGGVARGRDIHFPLFSFLVSVDIKLTCSGICLWWWTPHSSPRSLRGFTDEPWNGAGTAPSPSLISTQKSHLTTNLFISS